MKPNAIQFFTYSATSSSMIFIPVLASELGASDFEIGIIGSVYGLAMFFSFYIFGRASDVYGKKYFCSLDCLHALFHFLCRHLHFHLLHYAR